jgi:ATP-binding cassette, subfamily B, bacterial MsbA
MKNFVRALRMASRYWLSVALAAVCSFSVAALWGANIGAFYPILEVTIRGKSMQQWVDGEIDKHLTAIAATELQIQQLSQATQDAPITSSDALARPASVPIPVETLRDELAAHQTQHAYYAKLKPWIDRWVPASPSIPSRSL